MDKVKFFSNRTCQVIPNRVLPGYVPQNEKEYIGVISFRNGVYEASDEREIDGLREFIKARPEYCPIWEEGHEPGKPFPTISVEDWERQQEEERKKHEQSAMMKEFYAYLTQRKFPNRE